MHAFDHSREPSVGADIALLAVNARQHAIAVAILSRQPAIGPYALLVPAPGLLLVRLARAEPAGLAALSAWCTSLADPFSRFEHLAESGLAAADEHLAIAASDGRIAALTGPRCAPWSGISRGDDVICLTRRAVSPATAQAAVSAYAAASGDCSARLLQGLLAAQYVEGNRRRMRSAALLAVGEHGLRIDLRVDEHAAPLEELERLLQIHQFHYSAAGPQDGLPLTPELTVELQRLLYAGGYLRSDINGVYDAPTFAALERWLSDEQLERRFRADAVIDRQVLDFLRRRRWR
jgi:uncharacterized Ntn-hydrolase superfamily protein